MNFNERFQEGKDKISEEDMERAKKYVDDASTILDFINNKLDPKEEEEFTNKLIDVPELFKKFKRLKEGGDFIKNSLK